MKYAIGALATLATMLCWVHSAEAQYTAGVSGGNVMFNGGAAGDTLVFTNVAGTLTHNRFGTDPNFASPADLDTTVAGDQMILVANLTALTVVAGGGNDTVILTALTGVPAGATIVVNGDDGDDVLTGGPANETFNGGPGTDLINPGANNGEANTVNGDAGADTLAFVGTMSDNVFTISRTGGVLQVSIDGASSTVIYNGLEICAVTGLDGNDTFTVEPLDDLGFGVAGDAATDTLNIDAGGNLVVQNSSSVTVAGRLPITHTGVENVNVTNVGFSPGGKSKGRCGLTGAEALAVLALAAFRRRRR